MNQALIKMAKAWLPSKVASFMFRSVQHLPRERAYVYAQASDTHLDLSPSSRIRMVALARWTYYNCAMIYSAVNDIARYSVPVTPQARTSDTKWNNACELFIQDWAKIADIAGRDLWTDQILWSTAMDVDGEIFIILTESQSGYPMLQTVRSHRVATPPKFTGDPNIIDGIRLNAFGRPISYFVAVGPANELQFREIQAKDMIHLFEPEMPDQIRGYPKVGRALNDIIDVDDIQRYEKQAVKAGSTIGLALYEAEDEGTPEGGFFGKTEKQGDLTLETIFGGAIPRLKNGQKLESFMMNRPNTNLDPFLVQFRRSISAALDLPYEFVWDSSAMGGPSQRFVLVKAGRRFKQRQNMMINRCMDDIHRYVVAKAIKKGFLNKKPEWRFVDWAGPRAIGIDAGREAQQNREDIKLGIRTHKEDAEERGIDWQDERLQTELEADDLLTRAERLSKKFNISIEAAMNLISQRTPNANSMGTPLESNANQGIQK